MKTAEYQDSLLVNEKINLKTQLAFFPSLLILGEGTEHSNNKHHDLVYQLKAHNFTSWVNWVLLSLLLFRFFAHYWNICHWQVFLSIKPILTPFLISHTALAVKNKIQVGIKFKCYNSNHGMLHKWVSNFSAEEDFSYFELHFKEVTLLVGNSNLIEKNLKM